MKKTLLALLLVLTGVAVMARPVDQSTAVLVARNFALSQLDATRRAALGNKPFRDAHVVYTHTMPASGNAAIYAVDLGTAFVLVSADDVAHPVLGYNLGRTWPKQTLAAQVSSYLDDLARQIESAAGNEPDSETAVEWQELMVPGSTPRPKDIPDSVGPLLTTTWDQGQYYNALCPEDPDGPDGHVYTGCVATAMAQIINYWGYPVHGRGIHSYESDYGSLEVNYSNASYDFSNMPNYLNDTSTEAQIHAVAQLMSHCGIATNMLYGSEGSGTTDIEARASLVNFFRFSSDLSFVEKSIIDDAEWHLLLRENLDASYPIMYSGSGTGGHAFICDGYKTDDDYYHYNFGWAGNADGWYLTSAINPGSADFNSYQSALVGIVPDSTGNVILCQTDGMNMFVVEEPMEYCHGLGHNAYAETSFNNAFSHDVYFSSINSSNQLILKVISYELAPGGIQILGDGVDVILSSDTYEMPTPILSGGYGQGITIWGIGIVNYPFKFLISQVYVGSDTVEVCDNYTRKGVVYTESATFVDTVVTHNGCDSILTHHIIVNRSNTVVDTVSAIDSIIWNGNTYTESGIYNAQHSFTNTYGCDSIVSLWLTITKNNTYILRETDTIILTDTICGRPNDVKSTGVRIYTEGYQIVVNGVQGEYVSVYNGNGDLLETKLGDKMPVRFDVHDMGTYFLKIGNQPYVKVKINQ